MESIELEILEAINRSNKLPHCIVKRVRSVLLYNKYKNKSKVSAELSSTRDFVYVWLSRWENSKDKRAKLREFYESKSLSKNEYKKEIQKIFKDKFRSGTPAKFSQSDRDKIVALASESPEKIGLPFTHWTESLLVKEIINRKIVPSISTTHVARILKNKQVATA